MKYTKEQIRLWMKSAAEVKGYRLGKLKNGKLCLYRPPVPGWEPAPIDVIMDEDEFVATMERGE